MPQGSRGRIGIRKEKTWGTRDTQDDPNCFLPFASEGLTTNIEELMSAAQRGKLDEPKSYQGQRAFGGPIVVEVHPVSIGHLLRSALGAPSEATNPGTTEIELEDCEAAWVGHADIISTIDNNDYKKGSASIKLLVPEGVSVDGGILLATKDFDPVDMHLDTAIKFWIKSSILMAEVDLKVVVSEYAACVEGTGKSHQEKEISILVKDTWTEVTVSLDDMSDYNEVISIGIKMITAQDEFILRIDDVRRVVVGTNATAKQHLFTPMQLSTEEFSTSCPLFPYTIEVFPDEGKAFQFLGGVVNTLALNSSTTDKILKATCGIIAQNASLKDPIGTLGLEATKPFVWENATIKIAAAGTVPATTGVNDIESFSLTWDNKCTAKYLLNNTAYPGKIIRTGFREIPVSFTIDFVDKTEYGNFINGIERSFQIKFVGVECGTGDPKVYYTLQIDLPLVRYLTYPINMGGPGPITCAVTGKAKYDAKGYPLLATLINTKATSEYQREA